MSIIGTLLVKMALDAAGFRQEMAGAAQGFVDAGRRISQAGMDLAPVSVPILALGQSALSSAIDFESGMNVFQATSQATSSEMDRMRQLATELGADMQLPGTSAADAAEAMIELGRRGLEVNEVFDASRGVLELSAAGQLSNARAAELTASALNAFNLEGSDASRVANLLAAGSTASGTSIDQMGQALQQSAAVFAAADIPIEQLVTSIGMMAKAGIQGSDAGTSLKTMLMALQAPSSTAAAAMADLGINIYDAHGSMLPFPAIIEQFSAALADGATRTVTIGGATREMAAAAEAAQGKMTNLERALVVAEAHTGMTADTMRGLIQQWVSANGSLDGFGRTLGGNTYELFKAVQGYDSARNSIAQFHAAQGTARSGTVALSEAERNRAMATIFGTDAVRAANIVMMAGSAAFTEMEGASTRQGAAAELAAARMQGLGGAIEGFRSSLETTLMNAVMPFLPQLTNLVTQVGSFVGQLGAANPALLQAGVAVAAVIAVAGPLLMLIGPLTTAFAVLTGPIGLIVLGIAALSAAFASGAITIDSIRPVLDAVGVAFNFVKGIVVEVFTAIQGIISGAMQVIRGDISGGMDTIRTAFSAAWTNISTQLGTVIQSIISYVQQNLPTWIQRLGEWATAAWQWLVDAVPPMLEKLGKFVQDLLEDIGRRLPGWAAKLAEWASAAWQWLVDAVPPLLEKLGRFVSSLLEELGRKLPGWISAFLNWATEAVAWVAKAIPPLLVELGKFLGEAVSWIIGTGVPALVREAVKLAGALIDWVDNVLIPEIGPALGTFLEAVVTFLGDMVEAAAEAAWAIGEGIVSGIRQGVSDLWDSFRDWIGGLITAVIDWLKGLMGIKSPSRLMADEIGRPLVEGILLGAQEAAPGVTSGLANIVSNMVSAMANAATGLGNLGGAGGAGGMISGLIKFVSDLVQAFHEATTWITTAAINVRAQSDAFNAAAQEMLTTLQAGITLLVSIEDTPIPADGASVVRPLIRFVSQVVQYMHEQISWITTATINVRAQSDAFNAAAQAMLTTLLQGVALVNSLEGVHIGRQVIDSMRQLVVLISHIVQYLAQQIAPLTIQALAAARVFAENAGPVLTVIQNAVGAVNSVQTIVVTDVSGRMQYIAERIVGMVYHLSRVASWISVDARAAAAAFAAAVGPVVGVIASAVDAVNSVQTIVVTDVSGRMQYIAERIAGMAFHLNRVASWISVDARTAAAAFAAAVGPVVSVIRSAVDAVNAVQTVEVVDVRERMQYIAERIVGMVFHLNRVAGWISQEARTAAAAFAAAVGPVIDAFRSAVETIKSVQDLKPEPNDTGVMTYIATSLVAMVTMLRDVRAKVGPISGLQTFIEHLQTVLGAVQSVAETLTAIAEIEMPAASSMVIKLWEELRIILDLIYQGLMWDISRFDANALISGAFEMGANWVASLVKGIQSQLPNLIAVLAYIRDLFPHSPAKAGPLRQAPNWESYMTFGLDQAGDKLVHKLTAAMPAGGRLALAPAGGTGARGGQTINVTINNPKGLPAERSIRRELLTLSQLGVLE